MKLIRCYVLIITKVKCCRSMIAIRKLKLLGSVQENYLQIDEILKKMLYSKLYHDGDETQINL